MCEQEQEDLQGECVKVIIIITIYFKNVYFFHAQLGSTFFPLWGFDLHISLNTTHSECKSSSSISSFTHSHSHTEELHLTSLRWCCQSPIHQPCGRLRSATRGDLIIPSSKTVRFGPRSFTFPGQPCGTLSVNIRQCKSFESFKKQLKTFLYLRADST